MSVQRISACGDVVANAPEGLQASVLACHFLEGPLVVLNHILFKSINDKTPDIDQY